MIVHLTDTKAVLMGGAAIAGGAISQAFGGWDAAMMTLLYSLWPSTMRPA